MRVKHLEGKNLDSFKTRLSPRWRLVWDLGTFTGLRISDVLNIKCEDIKGGALCVTQQKTGKPVKLFLTASLISRLERSRGQFWYFPSPINPTWPVTRQAAYKAFRKAAKDAGIEDIRVGTHSMRKSYAVGLLRDGESLPVIQARLMHGKLETTLLYLLDVLMTNAAIGGA